MDSRQPNEKMGHDKSRSGSSKSTIKPNFRRGLRSNVSSNTKRQDQTRVHMEPSDLIFQNAIKHEEKHLADLKYDIEDLKRDERRYQTQILELQYQISVKEKEISTVGQDLVATQVHAPREATLSSHELVEHFEDMTGRINEIVSAFQTWYQPLTTGRLSILQARSIREHVQSRDTLWSADAFVEGAIGQNLSLVADGLIRHHLCFFIMAHVFRPFVAGKLDRERDIATLIQIQTEVRAKESQDYSGRWRALSYKHAMEPRNPTWCMNHASECVKEMKDLFILLTGVDLGNDSLKIALQLTTRVIDFAAQLKDDTMQLCTEMNHYVYFPDSGQMYNSTIMQEVVQGKEQSTRVVLPIGLGIQRSWSIFEDSGCVQKFETAIPADVVGNQSSMLRLPG